MIILQNNALLRLFAALAVLVIFWSVVIFQPQAVWGKVYREQTPEAQIGALKITLKGPAAFPRIDGLDKNLDDILLATQSPAAAILGIFAEPGTWKNFQSTTHNDDTSLSCHALISTPAPLANQNLNQDDFNRVKKDLITNLKELVDKERRLEDELGSVGDHKVEKAVGRVTAFTVLQEGGDFIVYRLDSSLEIKLKDKAKPKISHSKAITSTILLEGKLINLQVIADDQGLSPQDLEKTAFNWRESFLKANLRNP